MHNFPKLKAALFDLDGTLIDSEKLHFRNSVTVCKKFGYDYTEADFFSFLGKSMTDIFASLQPRFSQKVDFDTFYRMKVELFAQNISKEHIFDGVEEHLSWLKHNNIPCYVVTNGENIGAKHALEKTNLMAYIDGFIAAGDVQNPKPHPEPYLMAAKKIGCDPATCLMVEDSLTGLRAALDAGGYVVAVPTSVKSAQLQHAHYVADDFASIPFKVLFRPE